ncbi:ESCRT-III subunit protein snf7 [Orbilia brochopaga]|uniref:Vacuolar-sorting protein SNF7 n=1 Tax=Orbilia brochopaga TaxID=3140254 RepID=A0AAV9U8A6_9PEZI
MSGWFNSAWFGGGQSRSDGPKTAILKLREQKETLEKKELYLENQIKELDDKARKNVNTNKSVAKAALVKKKQRETELETTQKHIATLETQISSIEAANINFKTLEAMNEANKAMAKISTKYQPDKIDKVIDEIQENTSAINYMSERLTEVGQQNNQIDDDELARELESMQQEELDKKMVDMVAPPIGNLNTPEKQKQPAKEEEDEEEELRKLQAEMAM